MQADSQSQPERPWALETYLIELRWLPISFLAVLVTPLRYLRHFCVQWAAALSYYTLIGLVPLLTAIFALLKLFGFHRGLTPYVMSTVGAGSHEVAAQIVRFIDETNMQAVGVLSAIGAALATLAILVNAEFAFNTIWGGVAGRPLGRKVRAYTKVALLAPLLLLLALALTAFFRRGTPAYIFLDALALGEPLIVVLRLLPYALLWLGFSLLYTRLPNTTVRVRSAIFAAVVAGTLWQLAQWAYVTFVIRMVQYSSVYGALWQVPILLAWLYVAWSIILFGVEVSRAHQELFHDRLTRRLSAPRTPGTVRDE